MSAQKYREAKSATMGKMAGETVGQIRGLIPQKFLGLANFMMDENLKESIQRYLKRKGKLK